MVGGDADILEDVSADEKGLVVGIRTEAATTGNLRCCSERLEGCTQVDGRLSDRRAAERTEQQLDVLALFNSGLDGIGCNRDGGEGNKAATRDRTRRADSP